MIIWRGFGILVFVFLVIAGWIMSYFYEDTRLGNGEYMGWTMLCAVVPTLLLYLALRAYNNKEKELAPGEVPQEKSKIFTGHSFFFIPVVFWPLIYLVLGVYFVSTASGDEDSSEVAEETTTETNDGYEGEMLVNFYNPNDDTTEIKTFYSDGEKRMSNEVPPYSIIYATYDAGPYKFQYNDVKREIKIYGAGDLDTNSYNQSWYVLDPQIDLVLVNVSAACDPSVTESDIRSIDWTELVEERYKAGKLMSPVLNSDGSGIKYIVIDPGWELPLKIGDNEKIFSRIPINTHEEATDEFLDQRIVDLCF